MAAPLIIRRVRQRFRWTGMNNKGFSLLELLIALSLATFIIFQIGALELSSRRTTRVIDVQADLLDELNIAFSHMRNRVSRAVGYRAADDDHYGLEVLFSGSTLMFFLDEGSTRNGRYNIAPEPLDPAFAYRLSLGGNGFELRYYDGSDPAGLMIAENITVNPIDPDTGSPIPPFKIVDHSAANNQVLVTLTAEKEVEGKTYQASLQTLITAREMVN